MVSSLLEEVRIVPATCGACARRVFVAIAEGLIVTVLLPALVSAQSCEVVDGLIRRLGAADFQEREGASAVPLRIGAPALPALRKARHSPDPEIRRRAASLIQAIEARAAGKVREKRMIQIRIDVAAVGGRTAIDVDCAGRRTVSVDLSRKAISDGELATIRGWAVVGELNLSETGITDNGLEALREARCLRVLRLSGQGITDKAVDKLIKFKQIQKIVFINTQITENGLSRLYAAFPDAILIALEPPKKN